MRQKFSELKAAQERKHQTIIALDVVLREGKAKLVLGIATGRKMADKRQAIAEKDTLRDTQREVADARRGR